MALDNPRFRRDLKAVSVEVDGQNYVDVYDSQTGQSFRFYDFEYKVALAFDGRTLDKVIPWVKLSAGLELQTSQLKEFAGHLHDMGFLEADLDVSPGSESSVRVLARAEAAALSDAVLDRELVRLMAKDPPGATDAASTDDAKTPEVAPPHALALISSHAFHTPQPSATVAFDTADVVFARESPAAAPVLAPAGASMVTPAPAVTPAPVIAPTYAAPAPITPAPVVAPPPITPAPVTQATPPPVVTPVAVDSTAFPVLPLSPVTPPPLTSSSPRTGEAESALAPWMTPAPTTFGPALFGEQPSPAVRRRRRRSFLLFASLGVLAAVAVFLLMLPFLFSTRDSNASPGHSAVVMPGTVFRYFDTAGTLERVPGTVLKFPAGGKVTRIVSAGTVVSAGAVVAAVEIARALQTQLTRQTERLAFYRQMAEAMHQVGNSKEEERQASKVEDRNAKVAKTLRALASVAVVADRAGEVEQALVHEGDIVQVGSPALRLRSVGFRANFDLLPGEATRARRLGFCHVDVEGSVFDCTPLGEAGEPAGTGDALKVDLASVPLALLDKPVHLVRARFDNAFLLPAEAVVHTGMTDQVFVVLPKGKLETRDVTLADKNAKEAVVVQGLDPGDRVLIGGLPAMSRALPPAS